ncbi:pyruvate, phosphate dikinase [candidate division NPL-UPA2 bacterium]|nr:pyruvate, phosphate dikinase [candidate division NPL-UPA2 bacterium]
MSTRRRYVYFFGGGKADGNAGMKNELGGKGANLAEMSNLGIPVPPGFTITTEVCAHYMKSNGKYPPGLREEVESALADVEKVTGSKFGHPDNPLLFSIRSGARQSMPGMMETVLNIGLTEKTLPGLINKSGNERLAYDAYRRLIMMYSDVVMEKAGGIEPAEGQGIRQQLEHEMEKMKRERGAQDDTQLDAGDLKKLCQIFKEKVRAVLGKEFPGDPFEQLWGGIGAVFKSWNGRRAIAYRRIENIPDEWGTAVNIQAMVFGNMGNSSATGVAFTRNPATGERQFYGEFLVNAQGEDVVAGTRTPQSLNRATKTKTTEHLPSLEEIMPDLYRQLDDIRGKLETHYRDMQDIEFTIQEGKLYMLQTRTGKRNGAAAVKMAVDMCEERLISKEEALLRVKPEQLDELLHPMVDPKEEASAVKLSKGLPAGPGGAHGQIVFTADEAQSWAEEGKKVILVRNETSPEDVHGMHAAEAILTATGGMTSHAALVARGWGKCCIVGCTDMNIDMAKRQLEVNGEVLKEGDWITLNGTRGLVYKGILPLLPADPQRNLAYKTLMGWADEVRTLGIRTNADTPQDARMARNFGAEGIGLCRTEHMFFGPDRIMAMREMILSDTEEGRHRALDKLLPYQKKDFIEIFEVMQGLPVTIRTLDPPLHEFLPQDEESQKEMAKELGVSLDAIKAKVSALHEMNPMLGHRGCRLGVTYPEITRMQARAIIEAACELAGKGVKVYPEIMIPLIGTREELANQKRVVDKVAQEVMKEYGIKVNYLVGTMIEIPRASLTADEIAEVADFFSFGTNDLTQMTFGFSRDDAGKFLPDYIENAILTQDPFQTIDERGVGQLVILGIKRGRSTRPKLKVGICGEHGGDPRSIEFCHRVGMDYVSCSPYRVPIARLAAAQGKLLEESE